LSRQRNALRCRWVWIGALEKALALRLAWETSQLLCTALARSGWLGKPANCCARRLLAARAKSPALRLVQGANGMPFIAVGVRDTQKRLALRLR
jgi:hypothetical protein